MSLGLLNPAHGVPLPILAEKLGVAKSTAYYWARLGLIEAIEGSAPRRYLVPSPEKKEHIREAMRQRRRVGATKGGQSASQMGLSASHAAKARQALAKSPDAHQRATEKRLEGSVAQVPPGLVDGPTLCKQAGIGLSTLLRWRKGGYVSHAYQCPRLHTLYFEPLTPEQVQELRAQGRHNMDPHEGRLSTRPEGYITAEEAAQLAEVDVTTIKSAINRGLIVTTKVGRWVWLSPESVNTWRSRRGLAAQPGWSSPSPQPKTPRWREVGVKTRPVAAPLPRPKELTIKRPEAAVVAPKVGTCTPETATVRDASGDYEAVVSEAKTQPAFCGVLGFNLLRHNFTGEYRAASVSEKPQWPWRYHQKHYKNGWGNWTVASMNPVSGRVGL